MNRLTMSARLLLFVLSAVICLITQCTESPVSSGGTRGGNPVVTGKVIGIDGVVAPDIQITLIPSNYDPFIGQSADSLLTANTDSTGSFSIHPKDTGAYSIEALNSRDGSRLIRFNITTHPDSEHTLLVDTLHRPGTLKIVLGDERKITDSYLYVPGSRIGIPVDTSADTMTISSVPVSILPFLYLSDRKNIVKTIDHDILVRSNQSTVISTVIKNPSIKIILNTTAAGAGIDKNVFNFPVLIRLNSTNFAFENTSANGSNLVFKSGAGRTLPYEIECWDAAGKRAEIWVNVDTIRGDDSLQSIEMSWSDSSQSVVKQGIPVFDTAAGFQGVWHLNDESGNTFNDATINHYNGASNSNENLSVNDGVIGKGCYFNGTTQYITMSNTSNSKLNLPENGYYTVSAWVLLDTLDGKSHCIISKGFEQYYLRSTYISTTLPYTTPLWEFVEFSDVDKWKTSTTQLSAKQWTLIVGVHQGTKQLLYCNGVLVDSTIDKWQNAVSRNTKNDLTLGRFAESVVLPVAEGYCYFKGGIDEVRICNIAQSPEWVKLCYVNQGADDKLVRFSK